MLFICYPKCGTCRKAKKLLETHGISFAERNIKLDPPSADEITEWIKKTGLPSKKFFNTSGMAYKNAGIKDKIEAMSEDEKIEILASDGMLVKRPILIADGLILIGFKQEEWENKLKK